MSCDFSNLIFKVIQTLNPALCIHLVVKKHHCPSISYESRQIKTGWHFQVELNSALSLSQKWVWAALIITSKIISTTGSNVVTQFPLKSFVTLTTLASLLRKFNSALTNQCLCGLKCCLANGAGIEFVLCSLKSIHFHNLSLNYISLEQALQGRQMPETLEWNY